MPFNYEPTKTLVNTLLQEAGADFTHDDVETMLTSDHLYPGVHLSLQILGSVLALTELNTTIFIKGVNASPDDDIEDLVERVHRPVDEKVVLESVRDHLRMSSLNLQRVTTIQSMRDAPITLLVNVHNRLLRRLCDRLKDVVNSETYRFMWAINDKERVSARDIKRCYMGQTKMIRRTELLRNNLYDIERYTLNLVLRSNNYLAKMEGLFDDASSKVAVAHPQWPLQIRAELMSIIIWKGVFFDHDLNHIEQLYVKD